MKSKPELKIVVSNGPPGPPPVEPPPEQVEMPFAVVNGEPVTQLPRDLYIPPQALEVFLEAFEGPLDLLLYLIRKQNLDILDIPLAEITRQYMQYIDVMQDLQLELAGEYMVMAATLAEIKSRMLLPRPKTDAEGNEVDPRAELVRRLQEYERFKRAAENLDALPRLERDVWQTSAELKERQVVRVLPQITLQEMLHAFKEVVARSEMFAHHHIQRERLSVRARMGDILTTLEQSSFVEFLRLFRPEEGRMGVTVTFIAVLELVREGLIDIVQAEPYAPIHVRAAGPNRKLRVVADNPANDAFIEGAAAAEGVVAAGDAVSADDAGNVDAEHALADDDFDDDDDDFEDDEFDDDFAEENDFADDGSAKADVPDLTAADAAKDEFAHALTDPTAADDELAEHALTDADAEDDESAEHALAKDDATGIESAEHALAKDDATGIESAEQALASDDAAADDSAADDTGATVSVEDHAAAERSVAAVSEPVASGVSATAEVFASDAAVTAHAAAPDAGAAADILAAAPDIAGAAADTAAAAPETAAAAPETAAAAPETAAAAPETAAAAPETGAAAAETGAAAPETGAAAPETAAAAPDTAAAAPDTAAAAPDTAAAAPDSAAAAPDTAAVIDSEDMSLAKDDDQFDSDDDFDSNSDAESDIDQTDHTGDPKPEPDA